MREAAFIHRNKSRWEAYEKVVKNPREARPDELADLFVQVTDDLSFARTQYPTSRTTQYLNNLARKLHLEIYRNKKEQSNRFISFWKQEIPLIIFEARRPMIYASIIFIVSMVVGIVSTLYDDTFVRLILGDSYVNMTLENIKEGNPTKVYSGTDTLTMFVQIAWNNVIVSLRTFILGVFYSVGSGLMLFYNGIMVGSFITFMHKEQQLGQALPVIMLHGTIELTSIVIAGGSGFLLGNSLLFPGTYSRMASFKMSARKGLKIIIGLLPFIVLAAAIEGSLTRYAFMPWYFKSLIIGLSAWLMLYYFIIYPYRLYHGRH
jgi:uncharacterized membrane protein SpoIIM required for sporulation